MSDSLYGNSIEIRTTGFKEFRGNQRLQ
jgi:hypothetical protein